MLVVVSMAVFALFFYGPNDPAYQYCPENRCTPAKLEQIHHQMGLDRPAPAQYVEYMGGLVHSRTISSGGLTLECDWPCLGVSFKYKVSVWTTSGNGCPRRSPSRSVVLSASWCWAC